MPNYGYEDENVEDPIEVEVDVNTGEVLRITGMPSGYFLRIIEKDKDGDFHRIDYPADYEA